MDINKYLKKGKYALYLASLMLAGCATNLHIATSDEVTTHNTMHEIEYYHEEIYIDTLEGEINEHYSDIYLDTTENDAMEEIEEEDRSFLGVWRIDTHAFSTKLHYPPGIGPEYFYVSDHDIRGFIGMEVEYREDFVQLGEMRLNNPVFGVRHMVEAQIGYQEDSEGSLYTGSPVSDPVIVEVIPGYFLGPRDMLESLNLDYYIRAVAIGYPDYPEYIWRGERLDPLGGNITPNPVFSHFRQIDDDRILFAGRHHLSNHYVIATRISE